MKDKKIRTKIPKENKVRAELQKEVSSICPFCENSDVGHFEIHHIDENPSNHELGNLLLLCPNCHSKITKGDISQIEVLKKKIELLKNPSINKPNEHKNINFNSKVENAVVGNNNTISIKLTKSSKHKYPEGSIGFETIKANYIGHLISRYNEYKAFEVGKDKVNYAVFSSHLKKRYKIGATRSIYNLPIEKFDELIQYIQTRINSTKLAKVNGQEHKHYSTFEEYNKGFG